MRPVVLAVLGLLASVGGVRAQNAPGQIVNRFTELNPGYRARAGAFYEKQYLPDAAAVLTQVAANRRFTDREARRLLRDYIYDYLDAYIVGGGSVSAAEHAKLLRRLDRNAQAALCDDAAFARYLDWRQHAQGDGNPLCFLLRPPTP